MSSWHTRIINIISASEVTPSTYRSEHLMSFARLQHGDFLHMVERSVAEARACRQQEIHTLVHIGELVPRYLWTFYIVIYTYNL